MLKSMNEQCYSMYFMLLYDRLPEFRSMFKRKLIRFFCYELFDLLMDLDRLVDGAINERVSQTTYLFFIFRFLFFLCLV